MSDWIHTKLINDILAAFLDPSSNDKANGEDRHSIAENFKISINSERASIGEEFRPEETAVFIDSWIGRLGNNIFQLLNAYLIAGIFGSKTVIAPAHEFFDSRRNEHISFIFGSAEMNRLSITISGTFFPLPFESFYKTFGMKSVGGFYQNFRECLNLRSVTTLTDRDLVLFVRSGDIFTLNNSSIHSYGQPPLSFYEAAIWMENPDRIYLLAEDDNSPLVNGLLSLKLPNLERVRLGMRGDFEFILGAKNIATGWTSLILNLLNFSSNIQRCYSLEKSVGSYSGSFSNTLIKDGAGIYRNQILSNNWVHSPEQLKSMVEYPRSHLIFGGS